MASPQVAGASAPLQSLEEILAVAKEAALLAGSTIREAWLQRSEVKNTKSNATDLVTETDQRCEELVISLLKQRYPEHDIIGEESAGSKKYELTSGPTWTIDPIDGTTNFVHRLKLSCVIISFLRERQVLVGVVYDPMAGELFFATKGNGAFLERPQSGDRIPINVSGKSLLKEAVISMDPGYGRDAESVGLFCSTQAAILRKGARNIRILGSTGLVMAYVACGRLDAAFEEGDWKTGNGPKIWDFAAGKLLVEEAGGLTQDLRSAPGSGKSLDLLGRSQFCAATHVLAVDLVAAIVEGRAAAARGTMGAGKQSKRLPLKRPAVLKRPAAKRSKI